eukprot:g22463.t1
MASSASSWTAEPPVPTRSMPRGRLMGMPKGNEELFEVAHEGVQRLSEHVADSEQKALQMAKEVIDEMRRPQELDDEVANGSLTWEEIASCRDENLVPALWSVPPVLGAMSQLQHAQLWAILPWPDTAEELCHGSACALGDQPPGHLEFGPSKLCEASFGVLEYVCMVEQLHFKGPQGSRPSTQSDAGDSGGFGTTKGSLAGVPSNFRFIKNSITSKVSES